MTPVRAQGGEVEAVAEFGEEVGLPADQGFERGRVGGEVGDEADDAAENDGVRLALGQGTLGDGAGAGEDGEVKRIVHGEGGAGVDEFGGKGAELVGEAGDPAGLDEVAGEPERGLAAG